MKQFLAVVFVLAALSVCSAVTIDEVIQLSKLKTGDDLIIQIIEKGKLDKSVTSSDVIRMKQEGVTDPVIEAMLKQNAGDQVLRKYTVTNKKGKTINVLTNLDKNGKRMGGPPSEPATVFPMPEAPKEITVVIKREEPEADTDQQYDQPYAPTPMYAGYYGGTYSYGGYAAYPYFPQGNPNFHQSCGSQNGSNRSFGSFRDPIYPHANHPQTRPPMQSAPAPAASFAGTRSGGWKTH